MQIKLQRIKANINYNKSSAKKLNYKNIYCEGNIFYSIIFLHFIP